jgi:hypothetical protein
MMNFGPPGQQPPTPPDDPQQDPQGDDDQEFNRQNRDAFIDNVVVAIDALVGDFPKRCMGLQRIKKELEDEKGTDETRATTLSQANLLRLLAHASQVCESLKEFESWLCGRATKTDTDIQKGKMELGGPTIEMLELELEEAISLDEFEKASEIRIQLDELIKERDSAE